MQYIYSGPPTGLSLLPEQAGGQVVEVLLHPGGAVELPESLPYVQRLVRKGQLSKVEVPAAAPAAVESKKSTTNTKQTQSQGG